METGFKAVPGLLALPVTENSLGLGNVGLTFQLAPFSVPRVVVAPNYTA